MLSVRVDPMEQWNGLTKSMTNSAVCVFVWPFGFVVVVWRVQTSEHISGLDSEMLSQL